MKQNFKSIETKRKDGSIWFNDLTRKRTNGPSFKDHRYTEYNDATKSVHSGQYDDPSTGALGLNWRNSIWLKKISRSRLATNA